MAGNTNDKNMTDGIPDDLDLSSNSDDASDDEDDEDAGGAVSASGVSELLSTQTRKIHNFRQFRAATKTVLKYWTGQFILVDGVQKEDEAEITLLARRALSSLLHTAISDQDSMTSTAGDRTSPSALLHLLLRKIYLSFLKLTRLTTIHTYHKIQARLEDMIAIFSEATEQSVYRCAYVYIRMLALQVRLALRKIARDDKAKMEAGSSGGVKGVQSWTVVWSVRCWVGILCQCLKVKNEKENGNRDDEEEVGLSDLIYPLVQTIMGLLG